MALEIPKWLQNEAYSARLDRHVLSTLWHEGTMSPADLNVTQRAAGPNMSVDVSIGDCWVEGDDETNQGIYLCRSTAVENRTITNNASGSTRVDLVVVQVNDPTAGGSAGDDFTITVVAGTPGSGAPATPPSALLLATVTVVSGATSITNANITGALFRVAGRKATPGTMEFGAYTFAPNGWLLCDGANVSRTTYARLFSAVGTSFGVGDGSTTFGLPDLRRRIPMSRWIGGAPPESPAYDTLGVSGGSSSAVVVAHTHTVNNHSHTVDQHSHTNTHTHTATTGTAGAHTHPIPTRSPYNLSGFGSGFDHVMTISSNGTYSTSSAGSHTHSVTVANYTGNTGDPTAVIGTNTVGLTTNSTGVAASGANMPPFLVAGSWFIATG